MGQYIEYANLLGVPPVIANVDAVSQDEMDSILEQVMNLRSNSVGVFNKDTTLKLFEGKADVKFFLDFISYLDSEISHIILGSSSYASDKIADSSKNKIIKANCSLMEDTLNRFIKFIVDFNFSDVKQYPEFRFDKEVLV